MPKVLFFSDFHAYNWQAFAYTDAGGLNSRLVDQLAVLGQIKDYCDEHDVLAIVFGGDLFHSRVKIDVDVAYCMYVALEQLAKSAGELVLNVGNHDQSAKDGSIHSLEPFRPFAVVCDKPREIYLGGKHRTFVHPFTEDTEAFVDYCKTVPACDFFVAHQGISEALVGAFEVPLKADIPVSALPLDRARYCLLGHYHKHQWLAPNCAYIGSPLQLDFGERNEDKGFLVVDTETWEHEFILTNAPRFRLYDTTEQFKSDLKRKKVDPARDFVRVHGSSQQLRPLMEQYPRVQAVQEAPPTSEAPRIEAKLTATDRDLLTAYVERQNPQDLDKAKLLEMGLAFMGEE